MDYEQFYINSPPYIIVILNDMSTHMAKKTKL